MSSPCRLARYVFHAYIGSGQMVSQRETDRIIWRDLLAYADRTGNGAMYDQVLSLGEPPYRDMPWANSVVLGYYPLLEASYAPPAAYIERGNGSGIGPFGVLASEYAFIDKADVIRGLIDCLAHVSATPGRRFPDGRDGSSGARVHPRRGA